MVTIFVVLGIVVVGLGLGMGLGDAYHATQRDQLRQRIDELERERDWHRHLEIAAERRARHYRDRVAELQRLLPPAPPATGEPFRSPANSDEAGRAVRREAVIVTLTRRQ